MKKSVFITILTVLTLAGLLLARTSPTYAAFNQNRLIDDQVFDNSSEMSASQINGFLDSFSRSCISPGSGFQARIPTGYSPGGGFTYGYYASAGEVISIAAQVYGINPRVLITTLEKEQSLVTGRNSSSYCNPSDDNNHKYAAAMGYGCPDSGTSHSYSGVDLYSRNGVTQSSVGPTCVNASQKAGFSQQVIRAAWLLKFGQQRSKGNVDWAVITGSWDNSDDPQSCYSGPMTQGTWRICPSGSYTYYDGYKTIDSTSVHMDTGATAALYWYTPHFHGNQVFVDLYSSWFGSTYANAYDYQFVTSTATALNYHPGGEGSVSIYLKNTGLNNWYSDTSPPAGQPVVRLATVGYANSPFADTSDPNWLGTRNQVKMSPATVQPGETATFTMKIAAPYQIMSSSHRFVLIVGGLFLKDVGINFALSTVPPGWNPLSSTIDTRDMLPNQQSHMVITVQNYSSSTWYSDNNLPAGKQPTRLATIGYADSPFADTADPSWLGTRNQVRMTPDTVQPGASATFDAWFIGPISPVAVSKPFHFIVIVGGIFTDDKGLVFNLSTPVANLSFSGNGATNPPATMSPAQTATVTYSIINTGNVVWQDELYQSGRHSLRLVMNHPVYRSSSFYNSAGGSNWLSAGQVKKPAGTTWPGQTATFTFSWKAPAQTGTYHDPFQLAIGGLFLNDYGAAFDTAVQ